MMNEKQIDNISKYYYDVSRLIMGIANVSCASYTRNNMAWQDCPKNHKSNKGLYPTKTCAIILRILGI